MRQKFIIRWWIVSFFWLAALALTYCNNQKLVEIESARRDNAQQLAELGFQNRHAAALSRITQQDDMHFLAIDSPKLGLVQIDSQMRKLATEYKLYAVRVKADMTQAPEGHLPYAITANGSFLNVFQFLEALHGPAYVQEKHTQIKVIDGQGTCTLDTTLSVQYRIKEPLPHKGPSTIATGRDPRSEV